ncbi:MULTISPECIES: IPExxxVDY family protein [Galbibacter]|uniref:IPExxxVDY family protein n=1 Tax=Galbibacter pacificus TaxID=2996052 RepID=A0ABT6FSC5_9FLAO|nr:IPExxxVDY family protein [Galbibacter pacificus]MDG3582707.1 IPExxxVDY family protein [Galbibacter pacificus]MDG3586174.1 IPExxxVDY family protein [Galbibacter pacificus]
MAIYKLLDDVYEHSYTLIAIHGSLDDYRLAYFLNSGLNIKLTRLDEDVTITKNAKVPAFKWYDEENDVQWSLVKNKTAVQLEKPGLSLFAEKNEMQRAFLIPEYSKVDYFLKIDEEGRYKNEIQVLLKLKKIPGVITAYKIEAQQLKSKNNLIFLTNA